MVAIFDLSILAATGPLLAAASPLLVVAKPVSVCCYATVLGHVLAGFDSTRKTVFVDVLLLIEVP